MADPQSQSVMRQTSSLLAGLSLLMFAVTLLLVSP